MSSVSCLPLGKTSELTNMHLLCRQQKFLNSVIEFSAELQKLWPSIVLFWLFWGYSAEIPSFLLLLVKVAKRQAQAKVFIFLLCMMMILFYENTCAKTLDPLLFYLMPWKVIHGHLWRHYKQIKVWFVFTVLSITSLMNIVPHEKLRRMGMCCFQHKFQGCWQAALPTQLFSLYSSILSALTRPAVQWVSLQGDCRLEPPVDSNPQKEQELFQRTEDLFFMSTL